MQRCTAGNNELQFAPKALPPFPEYKKICYEQFNIIEPATFMIQFVFVPLPERPEEQDLCK